MKITYLDLNRGELHMSVQRLMHEGRFTPRIAYTLVKLNRALEKELGLAREVFSNILKAHAEVDEAGLVKEFPEEKKAYKIREGQQGAFEKAQAEMLKVEIDLPIAPIPIMDLERGCRISPAELEALEPVLDLTGFNGPQAVPSESPVTPATPSAK